MTTQRCAAAAIYDFFRSIPSSEPMEASKSLDKHEALWVQLGLPNTQNRPVITVMGRFVRGPAGHLGDYFGELVDAKMVRSNVDVVKGFTK